ncbi:response regulator [Terriglobus sp. 2YAB30_2]|uniref:response regulator n=1 Tax=unclassified Terriglobus TaxID=2628988 RepID=UPI003F960B0C
MAIGKLIAQPYIDRVDKSQKMRGVRRKEVLLARTFYSLLPPKDGGVMSDQHVSVVFVVDDEQVISESLAIILRREGYDASYFTNPLEALERMKISPPDLLISDVMMPEISGIELAIQVAKIYPRCKILLFSGQAATSDLMNDARAQGYSFQLLTKPVHPRQLLEEIATLQ